MSTQLSSVLRLSSLCLGVLAPSLAATAGEADIPGAALSEAAAQSRCEAAFGPGFAPTPGGGCGWAGSHVRVGVGLANRRATVGGEGGALRVNAGAAPAAMTGRLRLSEDGADRVIRR